MPRARMPDGADRKEFDFFRKLADAEGETNDCVPRAVAAATGVPYKEVLAAFYAAGRKQGRGCSGYIMDKVVLALGFSMVRMDLSYFNPPARAARGKHGITSHHPDRFPEMWRNEGRLICWGRSHAWAVVDGKNYDWSRGRSIRCAMIYKIVKSDKPRIMSYLEYSRSLANG